MKQNIPAKAATAAGTLTSLIAASSAHGIIVAGQSFFYDGSGVVNWSVDGTDSDFKIGVEIESSVSPTTNYHAVVSMVGVLSGNQMAGNALAMARPASGAVIDSLYGFNAASIAATRSTTASSTNVSQTYRLEKFTKAEPGKIGFKFTRNGGTETYYGYADFVYEVSSGLGSTFGYIGLSNVYYNNEAGQGITVGAVPEPEVAVTALGTLALGAAGLCRWRKRKAA